MKQIALTKGKFATVDDEDFERLNAYSWYALKGHGGTFYAMRDVWRKDKTTRRKRESIYMHRDIMNAPKGIQVDHIDRDGLNNVRCNLRFATNIQNNANKPMARSNTSGYKGVTWQRDAHKWKAQIMYNYRNIHIGLYDDSVQAAHAYDVKAKELFGEFARTNFTG